MTTLGGILAGLGTLPLLATASRISFPNYWNDLQFPLFLCGAIGTIVLGVAAKGVDDHSTAPQMQAATIQKEAAVLVKTADAAPTPIREVEVVNPAPKA